MAQFDVYRNSQTGAAMRPYLLSIQSDLFRELATRVVVPLASADLFPQPAERLMRSFDVDGRKVVMLTSDIASVPAESLTEKVASLSDQGDMIIDAIDFLLKGK